MMDNFSPVFPSFLFGISFSFDLKKSGLASVLELEGMKVPVKTKAQDFIKSLLPNDTIIPPLKESLQSNSSLILYNNRR
jgi:hypothetical protein